MATASPLPAKIEAYLEGHVSGQVVVGNQNTVIHAAAGAVVTVPERPVAPRLRSLPVLLRPRPFPGLLDREREIGATTAALDEGLSLDLHGPPGLGKSSLLRSLAHRAPHAALPDGIIHLSARRQTQEDLEQALFEAFWETDVPFRPEVGWFRHELQHRRALVLLDDVEVQREEIEALLDLAPGCVFVLASGERRLWGEMRAVALTGLPVDASLELLERELGRPLQPGERSVAERLATALEGHPLRVLQAAARVREEGLSLAEMEQQVAASTAGACLLAAAQAQPEPQRRLLAVLAAVGGGALRAATLEALADVTGAPRLLEELTASRLVEPHGQGFRLTGDLGRVLDEVWDLSSWRERAVTRFGAAPDRPASEVPPDEADAVRGLLDRSLADGRFPEAVRLARSVEGVLFRSVRWGSWALVLKAALRAAEAQQDRAAEAWCLHQLGSRALVLGDTELAREALSQALLLRESLGAELEAAITRHNLGLLMGAAPEPEEPPEPAPPSPFRWLLAALVPLLIGLGIWLWPRPGELSSQPTSLEFADQLVTTLAAPQAVTLRNKGGRKLAIAAVRLVGGDRGDFSLAADRCSGKTLEARESCVVEVAFTPQAEDLRRAEVVVEAERRERLYSVPLQGKGIRPRASLRPDRLEFGGRQVGTRSDELQLTLASLGSAPFVLGDWRLGGDAGDFTVRGESCARAPIPPQGECILEVAFTPQREGARRAELVVASAAGDRLPPVELTGAGTAPRLVLSPTTLALEQRLGATREVSVEIANRGTAPLRVNDVSLADGGAGFSIARNDCSGRTLAAGGACTVAVRFRAVTEGSREAGLTIAADAAGGPWVVRLAGTGTAGHLEVAPAALAFGELRVGRSQSLELSLFNKGSAPVVVRQLDLGDSKAFSLTSDRCSETILEPGSRCAVVVAFLPRREAQEDGELRVENDSVEGERKVLLAGRGIAPHLRIAPAGLVFGRQRVGARSRAEVLTLESVGGAPVEIGAVTIIAREKAFGLSGDCTRTLARGEHCTLQVSFAPDGEGAYRGEIRIAHDATGDPESVPLTGEGAAPHAQVEPKEVDFGEGEIGTRWKPRTVRVESVGDWPLAIQSVSLSPREGPFQLADSCTRQTLKTKDACTVTVSFLPGNAGTFRATLQIEHSASDSPQRVSLRGSATPPAEPRVSWKPRELNFGELVYQYDKTGEGLAELTVESVGTAPLAMEKVWIDGDSTGFTLWDNCAGRELPPGMSCRIELRLLPSGPGERSAELRFATNATGSPHRVKAYARVRPWEPDEKDKQVGIDPDDDPKNGQEQGGPGLGWSRVLDFGKHQLQDKGAEKPVAVYSTGSVPLVVKAVGLNGDPSAFIVRKDGCSHIALESGKTCEILVRFMPVRPGENSGEIWFETNAAGSPHRVKLYAQVERPKEPDEPGGGGGDLPPRDTEPPPTPGGLKPGSSSPKAPEALDCARLVLAWGPVKDASGGPVRYEIELHRRNDKTGAWEGVDKWVVSAPSSAADRYVRSSQTYRWRVRARDAAGNVSEPSRPLYFTCMVPGPF